MHSHSFTFYVSGYDSSYYSGSIFEVCLGAALPSSRSLSSLSFYMRTLALWICISPLWGSSLQAQSMHPTAHSLEQLLQERFSGERFGQYAKLYDEKTGNTWYITTENHSQTALNSSFLENLKAQKEAHGNIEILSEGKIFNSTSLKRNANDIVNEETNKEENEEAYEAVKGIEDFVPYTVRLIQLVREKWSLARSLNQEEYYSHFAMDPRNQALVDRALDLITSKKEIPVFAETLAKTKNLNLKLSNLDQKTLIEQLDALSNLLLTPLRYFADTCSQTSLVLKEKIYKFLNNFPVVADESITYGMRDLSFIQNSLSMNNTYRNTEFVVILGEMHITPLTQGLSQKSGMQVERKPEVSKHANLLAIKTVGLRSLRKKTVMDLENIRYLESLEKSIKKASEE